MQEFDSEMNAILDICDSFVLFKKLSIPMMDELDRLDNILKL